MPTDQEPTPVTENLEPPAEGVPPPAPAERPDWLPETLWTDTGFNAELFGRYRPPAEGVPATAAEYVLPTIDGVEIDSSDPLIEVLRTRAHEAGLGQDAFDGILTDYAARLDTIDKAERETAMAAIGDNAAGRIANVSTWLDGKLPPAQASALKALATSADVVLGLEKLMSATPAPRDPPPPVPTRKTQAEIRTLMQSPQYSGKPTERSADVIAEVEKWWADEAKARNAAAPVKP